MGRRVKPRAVRRSKQKASGELVSNKSTRAMRRQMRSMGMDMDELDGVQEVRIKKEDGEIVLNQPKVALIKQQGMEIYQVIANPEASTENVENEPSKEESPSVLEKKLIPEEDVTLVASQANVSQEEARKALEENDGDLAKAILSLKT